MNFSVAIYTGIYFTWILTHYIASHLYVYYCTPLSFSGFIQSMLFMTSPHCQALRWMVYNGALNVEALYAVLGAYLISSLKKNIFTLTNKDKIRINKVKL